MKNFILTYRRNLRAILIGAILGFLYYRLVGCQSGHCMISSNPFISTGYGGLLGYLFVSSRCARGNCEV
jgi:hypothetical protein